MGIAVEPRATVCYPGRKSLTHVGPIKKLLSLMGVRDELGFEYRSPLPLGAGYATSGSITVSASLSLSASRGLSVNKALELAHVAEVEASTGLGDVLAISCGVGLVIRFKPGAPGRGLAECFPLPPRISILSMEFGSMDTRLLIQSMEKYRDKALASIKRVMAEPSFDTFIEEARKFTLKASLLESLGRVDASAIEKTPGLVGYYAKKRVLVVIVEEGLTRDAALHLYKVTGIRPRLLQPSRGGPEVWSWSGG